MYSPFSGYLLVPMGRSCSPKNMFPCSYHSGGFISFLVLCCNMKVVRQDGLVLEVDKLDHVVYLPQVMFFHISR